jgi:phage shock protein A
MLDSPQLGVAMFKRIRNLFRGLLSLVISGFERHNPESLLEVEKEHLRTQIARYNQGLVSHAGFCENLMAQVKKLEADDRDLRARTSANLRAGNRDAASQYALRLQTVTRELEANRIQLGQAETTYKELIRARDISIKAAQTKIEYLKANLDDLKIKKATAELAEMASGMIYQIGGSGDTLDRLQNMVEEERRVVAGRARVARDSLNTGDIVAKEAEQKALADQALADFAAKEGIALGPAPDSSESTTTNSEAPTRTMGPKSA